MPRSYTTTCIEKGREIAATWPLPELLYDFEFGEEEIIAIVGLSVGETFKLEGPGILSIRRDA